VSLFVKHNDETKRDIFGKILEEDIPDPTIKNRLCCADVYSFSRTSVDAGDKIEMDAIQGETFLKFEPCTYHKVNITGNWSKDAGDNSAGVDFSRDSVFVQIYYKIGTTWTLYDTVEVTYQSGDTVEIDVDIPVYLTADTTIGFNYSLSSSGTLTDSCYPILNFSWFDMQAIVTRCPRVGWHRKISIPSQTRTTNQDIYGYVTHLPFNGYYFVSIKTNFEEKVLAEGVYNLAPTEGTQTLEMYGTEDTSMEDIAESLSYNFVLPGGEINIYNKELHGSTRIHSDHATPADRKITWHLFLSNGTHRDFLGGHISIIYLGNEEGL
jgi:hypothetical protein